MQKKITFALLVSIGTMMAVSCNENAGNNGMKTKEDSLNFAKKIMELYPEGSTTTAMARAADTTGEIAPPEIIWDSVTTYRARYDRSPFAKEAEDNIIKGYTIDGPTYQLIKGNDNIKSVFLAFGRKADGSNTILVLGLDGEGHFISDNEKHANYDYSNPCPDHCP